MLTIWKFPKSIPGRVFETPDLSYESWAVTERIISQVESAEMRFLRRVRDMTLRSKVRSCEIRKALNAEPLLRIERTQLHWFGHVTKMSQKKLARQTLLAAPKGTFPKGWAWTRWSDYITDLALPCLGVEPANLNLLLVMRYFKT